MSRVQLALNVSDLEAAIAFYAKLFDAEPAKVRDGYANFVITDPPLKLVLMEVGAGRGSGTVGALNHLGVEVETANDVAVASDRLSDRGLDPEAESETTCCFAVQDKVWVADDDGTPWEIYAVLSDAPPADGPTGDGRCCVGVATSGTASTTRGPLDSLTRCC